MLRSTNGGKPKNELFSTPIVERVHKKLEVWRGFPISKGGRSTLTKVVLSSMPVYFFSTLELRLAPVRLLKSALEAFCGRGPI